jgi:serine phosphatase RsbU (regulator of sigma subunit)
MAAKSRWSITLRLLLAVNIPLAVVLAVLLSVDYQRQMRNSIAERQSWLNEEARLLYRGLYYLGENDHIGAIQRLINAAATRLPKSPSSMHHVAVRWRGGLIQSNENAEASQELLAAINRADRSSDRLTMLDEETVVLGRFSDSNVTVYVAELATNIKQATRHHILWHLTSVLVLGVIAAVIVNFVIWKIVGRPLRRLARSVTSITADRLAVPYQECGSRELDELSAVIHTMSETLAANEETRRTQLARARRIQEHLLPSEITVPGLSIARLFKPAEDVAGDYYDIVPLTDGSWLICIADVAGHGIPAAIGAAILKAVLLDAATHNTEPNDILQQLNTRLMSLLPDQFVSMCVAKWLPDSTELLYASAGHEPAILIRQRRVPETLDATGPLLGISENSCWETHTCWLATGDRVLLVTDGLAEAASPQGALFGRDSLTALLQTSAELPSEDAIKLLEQSIVEHRQGEPSTDDCTVVLLQVSEKAELSEDMNSSGSSSLLKSGTAPNDRHLPR